MENYTSSNYATTTTGETSWFDDFLKALAATSATAQSAANIYTQIEAAQHGTYLGTNSAGMLVNPNGINIGGMNISITMILLAVVALIVLIVLLK
jgi:hypothetical protein